MTDDVTNKFPYSLKFQVLTDVSVVHLPDWTWHHQHDHILRSMRSSWSAAPWTPVNSTAVFSNSKDFAHSNSYSKFFQLLCRDSFKQIQIFNQITVFFTERHVYKQQWHTKYIIFTTLKNWKVKKAWGLMRNYKCLEGRIIRILCAKKYEYWFKFLQVT